MSGRMVLDLPDLRVKLELDDAVEPFGEWLLVSDTGPGVALCTLLEPGAVYFVQRGNWFWLPHNADLELRLKALSALTSRVLVSA